MPVLSCVFSRHVFFCKRLLLVVALEERTLKEEGVEEEKEQDHWEQNKYQKC
jgi:hypothetical protein